MRPDHHENAGNNGLTGPDGFVDSAGLMVIDEIQRVPDLLLAIKEQVDADPRPGRYLLSGSARVLALRGLPDTLPGRIETIELWPFSQGEIDGTADRFVDAIFDEGGGLENRRDEVVGIEVKASSTVDPDDFRGLRHLAARTGDDFIAGVVLYTGTQTLPFGPKMRAMPAAALWEI